VAEEEDEGGVLSGIISSVILFAIGYGVYAYLSGPDTITYANVDGKEYEITSENAVFGLGHEQQQYMRKLINNTIASIPDDANPAREKQTWIDASKAICNSNEFNAFGLKTNWFGYVDRVSMTDEGEIYFYVQIDETDNEVWEGGIDKRFYDVVLDLKEGDIVRFSGYFQRGDVSENECLATNSLLNSNPELYDEAYRFTFANVEKIPTRTVEVD
jgi:hypothetical protein